MRVATVRQVLPTTTGTLDFTASGYGTCIGAIFNVSGALAGDGTPTNAAQMSIGATDGTNQRCVSCRSTNGSVLTSTARYKDTSHCFMLMVSGGAVNGSAAFSSFITDGVRVNIDDAFGNAFYCEATLLFDEGGDDFYVGTGDTSSGNQTITSVGFQATYLQGFTTMQSSTGTGQTGAKFSMGFALPDGTQNAISFYEGHSLADGAPSARADGSYFLRDIQDASVNGAVQIGSFTSTGFTATQINGSGFEFYYVAVKCSNAVTLDLELSRSTTGSRSHTGPGGLPTFVCGWNSKIDALDSNFENGRAGAIGFWMSSGTGAQFNNAFAIEDASAVTDCQSTSNNVFPYLPDHDGGTATAIIGSITSFDATGITINYTTVDSVECYFALLAIQLRFAGTGAGTAPVPVGSGTAALEFEGSGAGNSLAPVGSGTATLEFVASGAGNAPATTGAGVAALEFAATGAGVAPAPTGAGTATHTPQNFTATGAGFAPVPQGVGQAEHEFAGTAAGLAPAPVGAGLAALEFVATAQGLAPVPVGSGQGLLEFTANGSGFAPVPIGDGAALLEFLAVVAGFAPAPVGAGVAEHVGFELPPMVCPSQLEGSYVVAAALLGRYLSGTALLGSREPVSQLEGEVC